MAKRLPPVDRCLNCDALVSTAFCPHCGQEAVHHSASFRTLFAEVADNLLNLDSKLFRSLHALVLKPGLLTVAYNSGKRVQFIAPFRLYITCSIAFFLALAWSHEREALHAVANPIPAVGKSILPDETTISAAVGTPTAASGKRSGASAQTNTQKNNLHLTVGDKPVSSLEALPDNVEEFKKLLPPNKKISPFELHIIQQVIKMRRLGADGITAKFLANFPNMMFLLLPIFAVTLKMLYIRSKIHYIEHLVFLLHTHAFAYLVLTPLLLSGSEPLKWFALGIPVYVFLAMRTVYQQPWWKTGVKLGMLTIGYLFIFTLCLAGTFFVTFLTI